MTALDQGDAILGCLLGGAIGDAIGGVPERGRLGLSDDTQMTLATCEAITAAGAVDPSAIAAAFVRWFSSRRFSGLGSATLKALRDLQAGAHWALAGATGEMAAGNGGAMRIAPLAFLAHADRQVVRDVVRITHRNDEAYLGALAVVLAIRLPWPSSASSLLRSVAAQLPDCLVRDRLLAVAELDASATIAAVAQSAGTSGWVVETVPFALVAGWHMVECDFVAVLDQLVAIGGDTDTIAAIAGQVAGARLGAAGLPGTLVVAVPERKLVEDIATGFSTVVSRTTTSQGPRP